jgi:hypothetical protein
MGMLVEEYGVEAWYLLPIRDYEQGPSALQDGMSLEQIFQARHSACTFIARIGQHLRLYYLPYTRSHGLMLGL